MFAVAKEMSQFMRVREIFVRNGKMLLIGEKMSTILFDSHYHAWMVTDCWPRTYGCHSPDELKYPYPVTVCEKYVEDNGDTLEIKLISLKYRISWLVFDVYQLNRLQCCFVYSVHYSSTKDQQLCVVLSLCMQAIFDLIMYGYNV